MNAIRYSTALVTICVLSAAAQIGNYPDGYWERQYPFGQQSSVSYNLALRVDSVSKSSSDAEKILKSAGATPSNGFSGAARLNYTLPASVAYKTVKRLMDLGELQQYTKQQYGGPEVISEVNEKIGVIEKEMRDHASALDSMPVASALTTSTLNRLKQNRDQLQGNADKAIIYLNLTDASTPSPYARYGMHGGVVAVSSATPAEGAAKGNLGAIRSALSIYYGDQQGVYPKSLSQLTDNAKYLAHIPKIKVGDHPESDSVLVVTGIKDMSELKGKLTDKGGWAFVADPASPLAGTIVINCTHRDTRGTEWYRY